jgi:hypothetical protein
MNDELERLFEQALARGPAAELRGRVLDAVSEELASGAGGGWQRRAGLAVALSILLAVALNAWIVQGSNRRRAELYGPQPVPRQIAEIRQSIESVTDAETGRLLEKRLAAAWRSRPVPPLRSICSSAGICNDPVVIQEDWDDEEVLDGAEIDRDRGGRADRDASAGRRRVGVTVGCTA